MKKNINNYNNYNNNNNISFTFTSSKAEKRTVPQHRFFNIIKCTLITYLYWDE